MKFELFVILFIAMFSFIQPAAAFDAGDAIALVLGLVIGFIALCAILGWWARRSGSA
jgi:hypothetical protein